MDVGDGEVNHFQHADHLDLLERAFDDLDKDGTHTGWGVDDQSLNGDIHYLTQNQRVGVSPNAASGTKDSAVTRDSARSHLTQATPAINVQSVVAPAPRGRRKRFTWWLSKMHAGVESTIFLAASAHGASLCFYLFTFPFSEDVNEHYRRWVHGVQIMTSAVIIILVPISGLVADVTGFGHGLVTRLHYCNPELLLLSSLYQLLHHLGYTTESRGGSCACSNVSVTSSATSHSDASSFVKLVLQLGTLWCIVRAAIVGFVFAVWAIRTYRYACLQGAPVASSSAQSRAHSGYNALCCYYIPAIYM